MTTVRMAAMALLSLVLLAGEAAAQKRYDPGASDTEIKLGQTMPYSGPLSGFITLAKAEIAYFQMINDQGGVNGRKITMISLDDGFSPPKTVEQTRRLVEQDQVLALSGSLGTSPTDYQPMEERALQRFNGERFEVFGELLSARFD